VSAPAQLALEVVTTRRPGAELEALAQLDEAPPTVALAQLGAVYAHPVASFLLGLSEGSRPAMLSSLQALARGATAGRVGAWSFAWWTLQYSHTQAMRAQAVAECGAPASARKRLAALSGVLRACRRLGLVDPAHFAAVTDWDGIKGKSAPTGRHLAPGELRALFEVCASDPTIRGRRDAALLSTAIHTGARRTELVSTDLAHYTTATGTLLLTKTKNATPREAYLHDEAHATLAEWLRLRGPEPGPIFCCLLKSGRIEPQRRLSAYRFWEILLERRTEARLDHLTPHDFRRTFGGELLDRGADLSTVQQLLGHSDAGTTAGYDKRGAETRRRASRLMQVPIK